MTATISRKEATERLTARYNEQAEKYPLMRREITLANYISRNIRLVRELGLLASYAKADV